MKAHASIAKPDVPAAPPWVGSAHQRLHIDLQWLTAAAVLPAAALIFFGWRGLVMMLAVLLAAMIAHAVMLGLRRLLKRAGPSRVPHAHMLTLALLLGAAMPLFAKPWIALAAGGMLGIAAHMVGRSHRLRVHPVALVMTLVWLLPTLWPTAMQQDHWTQLDSVLRPQRLVVGNVRDTTEEVSRAPWWSPAEEPLPDALRRHDAGSLILDQRHELLQSRAYLVRLLSTGQLVRLEELFLGAHNDATGAGSRAVLLFMGFYLMYRRLAYWQTAAAAAAAAILALLLMPAWNGQGWTLTLIQLATFGPTAAVTWIAYMLFATPLVFIVMVLAPMSAPMNRTGRIVYGLVLGSSAIALMSLLVQPQAAYAALLLASLLSRPLDALQRSAFVR